MRRALFGWIGLWLGFLTALSPAGALEPLPAPEGPTLLTVSGAISVTNAPDGARFDRALLESLPWTTVVTETDWTEGPQRFEGVLLRDLLERLGGRGSEVLAHALNQYSATIPWTDLDEYGVLLALERNGAEMPIRDKGPIWIIYPERDSGERLVGVHNAKMVWQLERLEVR